MHLSCYTVIIYFEMGIFLFTGWCSKHWTDSWKWCCWGNSSAYYLHLSRPRIYSYWLLCEQRVHRPRASWKPSNQARLHTGQQQFSFIDSITFWANIITKSLFCMLDIRHCYVNTIYCVKLNGLYATHRNEQNY